MLKAHAHMLRRTKAMQMAAQIMTMHLRELLLPTMARETELVLLRRLCHYLLLLMNIWVKLPKKVMVL
uniref:Uncharacterized protein n=1 Tax=Arundo donax TaxID=35708 RepID=A0A0A9B0Z9_ARUDO